MTPDQGLVLLYFFGGSATEPYRPGELMSAELVRRGWVRDGRITALGRERICQVLSDVPVEERR